MKRMLLTVVILGLLTLTGQAQAGMNWRLVKNVNTGSNVWTDTAQPETLTDVDGILYFAAFDGTHGQELWKSDGTEAGTVMVKDTNPSNTDGGFIGEEMVALNGELYFTTDDGIHGRELWKSDGTEAGTFMVKDTCDCDVGLSTCWPERLTVAGNWLFFVAEDADHGRELWKSDGTPEGTVMVKDISPGVDSSWPFDLVNMGGTLYFCASTPDQGAELWKSDGTEAGTVLVMDIYAGESGSSPAYMTEINGTLYFVARDDQGHGLWKSGGTEETTELVKRVLATGGASSPKFGTAIGLLFFVGTDATYGEELWVSDGTSDGTTMVKETITGLNPSDIKFFTEINGKMVFASDDTVHGRELWQSDGTAAGTSMIKDVNPSEVSYASDGVGSYDFAVLGNLLYFVGNNDDYGMELWQTDGTEAGTVMVQDFQPGADHSAPQCLTVVNGKLYASVFDRWYYGRELFRLTPKGGAGGALMLLLN